MILILSSFVASSPVGGSAQALALQALGIETVLAPTVLFGRHPGLGPPGGGPVAPDLFAGLVEGVVANGVLARCEAVICGYFADPAQVETAARTLGSLRRERPDALIVVDPIMGDEPKGLYVADAVARAIAARLVPLADLIAPNAWELARLVGRPVEDPAGALAAARRLGRSVLVSSVPVGDAIGVVWADAREAWLASHPKAPIAPNGTGDLLTALFTAARLGGAAPSEALATAVGEVAGRVLGGEAKISLEALA